MKRSLRWSLAQREELLENYKAFRSMGFGRRDAYAAAEDLLIY